MTSDEEKRESRDWMWEAMIAGTSPIFAYLFAFVYEAGFALEFDIPFHFIAISLTTVFVVAGGLLLFLLFLLLATVFLLRLFPKLDDPLGERLAFYVPGIVLIIALRLLLPKDWLGSVVLIGTMLILAVIDFVKPLLTQRGKATYREKVEAQAKADEERRAKTLLGTVVRNVGKGGRTIWLIGLGLIVTHSAGRAAALREEEFLVVGSSPELVVLRIYGENLICARFDRETKKVERAFLILKAGGDSTMLLRLERIGPLEGARRRK